MASRAHIRALRTGEGRVYGEPSGSAELDAWEPGAGIVGQRHPRLEAEEKCTGAARYSCDVRLPNQLYAAVLRCPHPHARLVGIDTSAAEALPGVYAVLSADNAPAMRWHRGKLFDHRLRYVGDEVAAVAADSRRAAEDALARIDARYETLPFVLTPEAALAPDAPLIHEDGNRVGEPAEYARGDADAGFSQADVVIDQVYTTQTALHNCLEPHGCTAQWTGGQLTVWESTQGVHAVRDALAETLGLGAHQLRVIAEHVGGGFGSKLVLWKHTVIAALLARRAGRPVQLMLDRRAENLAVGNRHGTRQHVRLGAKRDGTLTGISVDILVAMGADAVGGESSDVDGIYQRLYRCPNVQTRQTAAYVNTGPSAAFRAPGYVEGAFGLESAMDELARALQMDPLELRLANYADEDPKLERPYSSPDALRRCFERAGAAFGSRGQPRAGDGSRRRGIGVAAHVWGGAGFPPAYATVRINHDGTADVMTGTQDIGTGTRTGLAQIAAEELGLALEHVAVQVGDTRAGAYAPLSGGSATLATMGPAVRAAASDAKAKLLGAAASVAELGEPAELAVRDGIISVPDAPSRRISVAEVAARIHPHMLLGHGARSANDGRVSIRTFGVQCAEIEVDVETGEITVLRLVASHDCGRIVNPMLVDSQVIGGVTQGLGFALMEERIVDAATGAVLTANLEDYKMPTAADVPRIEHAPIDVEDRGANAIGAKGIGEPPVIPTAPAIANAIFDAVGVRLRQTPMSRRRLLAALDPAAGEERGS